MSGVFLFCFAWLTAKPAVAIAKLFGDFDGEDDGGDDADNDDVSLCWRQ